MGLETKGACKCTSTTHRCSTGLKQSKTGLEKEDFANGRIAEASKSTYNADLAGQN